MTWRHPTTILREELAARGVLPAPPRGQRTAVPWQVRVSSEKRDGRWYSWPDAQTPEDRPALDRALVEIVEKYGLEQREINLGDICLAWPEGRAS